MFSSENFIIPISVEDASPFGVRELGYTPSSTYWRKRPEILNPELLAESDLSHLRRVFEQQNQEVKGMRLFEIADCAVLESGAIIVGGKYVLEESINHSRNLSQDDFDRAAEEASLAYREQKDLGTSKHIPAALLLNQWSSNNYGHFIVEVAPKIKFAAEMAELRTRKLLINRRISGPIYEKYKEFLACVGVESEFVRCQSLIFVGRLLFATTPGRHGSSRYKPAVDFVREVFLRENSPQRRLLDSRRLWITRSDKFKRRLQNQCELFDICRPYGFEAVSPEGMTISEQAELFNSASICVGPIGAAFSNIIFCAERAKVVTLAPNFGREIFFFDVGSMVGVDYYYLFGQAENPALRYNSDYRIEPQTFAHAIARLCSDDACQPSSSISG